MLTYGESYAWSRNGWESLLLAPLICQYCFFAHWCLSSSVASTARTLSGDKVLKVRRLGSCENCVSK